VRNIRSALPAAEWPGVPGAEGAYALALQFQLESSQWLEPGRLRELQYRQLDALLRHAWATVPYYRDRWSGVYDPAVPLDAGRLARLPVLNRGVLQQSFEALKSEASPPAHGALFETRSSGSTGTPVRVLKTPLTQVLWQAAVLREVLWHRRDFKGRMAVIRRRADRSSTTGWGPPVDAIASTGPMAMLPTSEPVEAQLAWLEAQQPDYLITYPSNLAELARLALARGTRIARLREVQTLGEVVTPELRALCRDAWGVRVVDAYSSEEAGYLALQCPEHDHYHVQSEFALVEVIDARGRACESGGVGLVVATPLHNFAMPLVRYVLGDYAEVGAPCSCGRGLPVLRRVVGRVRNTLVTAEGERYWPSFGTRGLTEIAPILQHQFVQKSFDLIEARFVTAGPLTPEQEESLRRKILSGLPAGFRLTFAYPEQIARGAGGKFEDFISEVQAPGT
jgi:phenylacetate-CoA ligase